MIKHKIIFFFFLCIVFLTKIFGKYTIQVLLPVILPIKILFLKKKQNYMISNMQKAIPNKSLDFYKKTINDSFYHAVKVAVMFLKGEVNLNVNNEGVINDLITQNKGAIVITSHHGNWEGLFQYFQRKQDVKAGIFYKKIPNPYVNNFLKKLRGLDQYPIGEGHTKKIIQRLKQNSTHTSSTRSDSELIIIGIDLHPKKYKAEVNFLNRKTDISPVAIEMAIKADVPIIVANSFLDKDKTHIFFNEIKYNKLDPVKDILQKVMDHLSMTIIERPGQWVMWSYNFWRDSSH